MDKLKPCRKEFEDWISSPPYEREIERFPNHKGCAWPGMYEDLAVQLAWEAWKRRAEPPWVRCSERLPTEADADDAGNVWICSPVGAVWLIPVSDITTGHYPVNNEPHYWKPTGLERPQPPEE